MLNYITRAFKRKPHIEIVKGAMVGLWHWRIVAANGEIQAASEVYDSKSNAQRAARNMKALTGWKVIDA
jgi:uncharacterized protein YegP (UPF0339 family)